MERTFQIEKIELISIDSKMEISQNNRRAMYQPTYKLNINYSLTRFDHRIHAGGPDPPKAQLLNCSTKHTNLKSWTTF